jgi:hypothetical protein
MFKDIITFNIGKTHLIPSINVDPQDLSSKFLNIYLSYIVQVIPNPYRTTVANSTKVIEMKNVLSTDEHIDSHRYWYMYRYIDSENYPKSFYVPTAFGMRPKLVCLCVVALRTIRNYRERTIPFLNNLSGSPH